MSKAYHILNGDSLKDAFPTEIEGEVIVLREGLIDGPVQSKSLASFYKIRSEFISQYPGYRVQDYYDSSVKEFEKILGIPKDSKVYFWFEDDVFCQLNFWFATSLLANHKNSCYLVRPPKHSQYGFAQYQKEDLISLLDNSLFLDDLSLFQTLWHKFQNEERLAISLKHLPIKYSFLKDTLKAIGTLRTRPKESIATIISDLNTDSFEAVFKEFSKKEAIYGLGDLQAKRIFDELMSKK